MGAMPSPEQSRLYAGLLPAIELSVETPVCVANLENDRSAKDEPASPEGTLRSLARAVITFYIGVAATLAWQSYGDEAGNHRDLSPQLSWLARRLPLRRLFRRERRDNAQRRSHRRRQSGTDRAQRRPDRCRQPRADRPQRRPACGRPGADGARDHQTPGHLTVRRLQNRRPATAAGRFPGAPARNAAGALTAHRHPRARCNHMPVLQGGPPPASLSTVR